MKKNYKVDILALVFIVLMILGVFLWNRIVDWQNKDEDEVHEFVDVSDANNVSVVDSKLGEDVRITQSYLLNYTVKKAGTWYQSSGYVKNIKTKNRESIVTLSVDKNSKLEITGTIDTDSCKVKKGDYANFVGTINYKDGSINLVKITKDEINYASVSKIEMSDLVTNFRNVISTYFVVSGYLVDDGIDYMLYESKSAYDPNSTAMKYFYIKWKDNVRYSSDQDVKLRCLIASSNKLKDCTVEK